MTRLNTETEGPLPPAALAALELLVREVKGRCPFCAAVSWAGPGHGCGTMNTVEEAIRQISRSRSVGDVV